MADNLDKIFNRNFPVPGSAIAAAEVANNYTAASAFGYRSVGTGKQQTTAPFHLSFDRSSAEIGTTRASLASDFMDFPVSFSGYTNPQVRIGITLTPNTETIQDVSFTAGVNTLQDIVDAINTAFGTTVAYKHENATDSAGNEIGYLLLKAPGGVGEQSWITIYDATTPSQDVKDKIFSFTQRQYNGFVEDIFPYTVTGATPFTAQAALGVHDTDFSSIDDEILGNLRLFQYLPRTAIVVSPSKRPGTTTDMFPMDFSYRSRVRSSVYRDTAQDPQEFDVFGVSGVTLSQVVSSFNTVYGSNPTIAFSNSNRLVIAASAGTNNRVTPKDTDDISSFYVEFQPPDGDERMRDIAPMLFPGVLQSGLAFVGNDDEPIDYLNFRPEGSRVDPSPAATEFRYDRYQEHYERLKVYGQSWTLFQSLRNDYPYSDGTTTDLTAWHSPSGMYWGTGLWGPHVDTKDILKRSPNTAGVIGIHPGEVRIDRTTGIPWGWAIRRAGFDDIPNGPEVWSPGVYEDQALVWRRAVPYAYRHIVYHDELEAYGLRYARCNTTAPYGTRASALPTGVREDRFFVTPTKQAGYIPELIDVRDGRFPLTSGASNSYGTAWTTTFSTSGIHRTDSLNLNRPYDAWDDFHRSPASLNGSSNTEQLPSSGSWSADSEWSIVAYDDENAGATTTSVASIGTTTPLTVSKAYYAPPTGTLETSDDMVVCAEVWKESNEVRSEALWSRPAVGVIARSPSTIGASDNYVYATVDDHGYLELAQVLSGVKTTLTLVEVDPPLLAERDMVIRLEVTDTGSGSVANVYWPSTFDRTKWKDEKPVTTSGVDSAISGSANRNAGVIGTSTSTDAVYVGRFAAYSVTGTEVVGLPEVSGARLRNIIAAVQSYDAADTDAIVSTGGVIDDTNAEFPLTLVGGTGINAKTLQDERTIIFELDPAYRGSGSGGGGGTGTSGPGGTVDGHAGNPGGTNGTGVGLDAQIGAGTGIQGEVTLASDHAVPTMAYAIYGQVEDPVGSGTYYHPEIKQAPLNLLLDAGHLDTQAYIHGVTGSEKTKRDQFIALGNDFVSHAGGTSPSVWSIIDWLIEQTKFMLGSILEPGASNNGLPSWMSGVNYTQFAPGDPYTSSFVGPDKYWLKSYPDSASLPTKANGKFVSTASPPTGLVAFSEADNALYYYDSASDAWSVVGAAALSGTTNGYTKLAENGAIVASAIGESTIDFVPGNAVTITVDASGSVTIASTDEKIGQVVGIDGTTTGNIGRLVFGKGDGIKRTAVHTETNANEFTLDFALWLDTSPTRDVLYFQHPDDGLTSSYDLALGGSSESDSALFINSGNRRSSGYRLMLNGSVSDSQDGVLTIRSASGAHDIALVANGTEEASMAIRSLVGTDWVFKTNGDELVLERQTDGGATILSQLRFDTSQDLITAFSSVDSGIFRVEGDVQLTGNLRSDTRSIPIANVFSTSENTMDDVADGTTYAKVLATNLTGNEIDFTKITVGKNLDNLPDGVNYKRLTAADHATLTGGGDASALHTHLGFENAAIGLTDGTTVVPAGSLTDLRFSTNGFTVAAVGGVADVSLDTGTGLVFSGGSLAVDFGTGSGQAAQGNHTHDGTDAPKVSYTDLSNVPTEFTPSLHALVDHSGNLPADRVLAETEFADGKTYTLGKSGSLNLTLNLGHDGIQGIASTVNFADHTHDGTPGSGGTIDYSSLTGVPSSFTPSPHATSHHEGGADEIDGEKLSCVESVSNYTPTASTISGHIQGIDNQLGKQSQPALTHSRSVWQYQPVANDFLVGIGTDATTVTAGIPVPLGTGGKSTIHPNATGWKLHSISVSIGSVTGGLDAVGDVLEIAVVSKHGSTMGALAGVADEEYVSYWRWSFDTDGSLADGGFKTDLIQAGTGTVLDTSNGAWYNAEPDGGSVTGEDAVAVFVRSVTSANGTPTLQDLQITLTWEPLILTNL